VRERIGRIAFTTLLVGIVTAVLAETLTLSPSARLVPLAVAAVTLVLLSVQLLGDLRSSRAEFEEKAPYRLSWLREQVRRALLPAAPRDDGTTEVSREFWVLGWIAVIPVLTWLVGVAVAAPLYTLVYVRKRAREHWPLALVMTMIVAGFPWALARLGIAGRLYEGALWRWLGA
jgi:hypothetical protein